MKTNSLILPRFSIESLRKGDEFLIGSVLKKAWLDAYLNPEAGITEKLIDNLIGSTPLKEEDDFKKDPIPEVFTQQNSIFYRVVRNSHDEIVGFIHCIKDESFNEIGGLNLINEAKGFGVGTTLVEQFLVWADKEKPCRLEVFTFNDKAIRFYTKFGFCKTEKKVQPFEGSLPLVEMIRPAEV